MARSTNKSGECWELAAYLIEERRLGFVMVGGGLLYLGLTNFGMNLIPCPFLTLTGLPCPGCGMTRACFAFLHGDWKEVWHLNPFGPLFAMFWVVVGTAIILPQPYRTRFKERLGRMERRTRWSAWVACGLLIHSLTRWF